ncbi:MAG: diaminopimelate decarboxylase, partial [Lachnospiraceae bacterium]|nr:diaminopimelate decarboxylase [Lachnospiraceae bacterium]
MMDDTTLQKLAEEFGTPCFVFDADGLAERVKSIKKILNTDLTSDSIRLCYSIKANPFLIPAMIESGVDKLEVCSPGELSICKSYKVPGEMIIYSGVHKEIEDITDAIEYEAGLLTAESVRHYELIREAAGRFGGRIGIILRLSSKSQFGMSPEDIEHILIENKGHDMVEIRGLHYFVGTQRL